MKIAFYCHNKKIVDRVINLWTGNYGYSHVELIFSDGICFSASPREGIVRFKDIYSINDTDKWYVQNLYISPLREIEIRKQAESLNGKKYDWKGIFLTEILPLRIDDEDKWYCSEICGFLLKLIKYKISPNALAIKMGIPRK